MKRIQKKLAACILLMFSLALLFALPAFADGPAAADESQTAAVQTSDTAVAGKSIGSGIAIGIAAAGGAVGMGLAVGKAAEGISRQPEADGKIRTTLMLGLVFIETAIIYALLAVILVIFVL